MEAIQITLPEFDGCEPLLSNLLTFDEITIINAIASIQAKMGNLKVAIRLGEWLKEYMEERVIDENEKKKKYPMILFNLSNWLGKYKRYWEAVEVAQCGIEFCIETSSLCWFPELIFNKACALAEVGKLEDAKVLFAQAIVIFQSIGKNEMCDITIAMCKRDYHFDMQTSDTQEHHRE